MPWGQSIPTSGQLARCLRRPAADWLAWLETNPRITALFMQLVSSFCFGLHLPQNAAEWFHPSQSPWSDRWHWCWHSLDLPGRLLFFDLSANRWSGGSWGSLRLCGLLQFFIQFRGDTAALKNMPHKGKSMVSRCFKPQRQKYVFKQKSKNNNGNNGKKKKKKDDNNNNHHKNNNNIRPTTYLPCWWVLHETMLCARRQASLPN